MNIDTLFEAYRHAAGHWKGCDWPTQFGPLTLNLYGLTPVQARTIANATSSEESRCWHEAADWLTKVELAAGKCEALAKSALDLAVTGQLLQAFSFARQASEIEREFHPAPRWNELCETIEIALDEQGPIADTHAPESVHGPVMMAWSLNSTTRSVLESDENRPLFIADR